MLEPRPNRDTPTTLARGALGWPVFALQRALIFVGAAIDADGVLGADTVLALKDYQRRAHLVADGIAGPMSQRLLVTAVRTRVEDTLPGFPDGLLHGLIELESASNLGAVNWSAPGGVDCGVIQRRVYGPPYDAHTLRLAYAPAAALDSAAMELEARAQTFRGYGRSVERCWRLAALAHNWPWAAGQLARHGALPSPDDPAPWVPNGLRFPDGVLVHTRAQWCEFYALGGRHGEGRATRYVTDWQ
jgi:hypothetical protein